MESVVAFTLIMMIARSLGCICLQPYATDLHNPVFMEHLPHLRQQFLVVEQQGVVRQFDGPLKENSEIYLDLRHKVVSSDIMGEERGLLGLALDPNFGTTKILYTYQTVSAGGIEHSELAKYDGKGTEEVLLRIPQTSTKNNGGMLMFDDEGYLYVFVGDSKSGDMAQNVSTLLGKVLRIDISKEGVNKNYSIPIDNPFVGNGKALPEIYATGFANPWRCSSDLGDPNTGAGYGDIYCGENGEDNYDEIDIIVNGGNYGWNVKEGLECIGSSSACNNIANEKLPIFVYPHINTSAAVIGGYMYRGFEFQNLNGKYLFGESISGKFMTLMKRKNQYEMRSLETCNSDISGHILSFSRDHDGELYVLMAHDLRAGSKSGAVYKIVPPSQDTMKCRASYTVLPRFIFTFNVLLAIYTFV